jgi:ubiquinone/menaquinone biosynthesis C-methylase UbiE
MAMKIPKSELKLRTPEQIREHYQIEKELARMLRNAPKQERGYLYKFAYDELWRRVPSHPYLVNRFDIQARARRASAEMRLVSRFLRPNCTFLEIGPGDCSLSLKVARWVRKVYAIDVSSGLAEGQSHPCNFELIITDGCSIPIPDSSVDVAYSNQVMEHLHPDDAIDQLRSIHRVLVPGGVYICLTPNRLNGPHDVSRYFDDIATCLHLQEYTNIEVAELLRKAGFRKVRRLIGGRGFYLKPTFPLLPPIAWCERSLDRLPPHYRRLVSNTLVLRLILVVNMVATK